MKRDLDLIRDILLRIEAMPPEQTDLSSKQLKNLCDNAAITDFHIKLLLDSKFIEVTHCVPQNENKDIYFISRLTSSGCDYLDSIRNPKIWEATKEKIKSIGDSVSLEIVKDVAISVVRSYLGV